MDQSQVNGHDATQDDGSEDGHEVETPSQAQPEEEGDLKFYNPNQDPEQRRKLRATMRDHQRMVDGEFGLTVRRG
jgi:hypothetical protein